MADTRHQRSVARALVCRVVHVVGHRGEAQRRRLQLNKEPAFLAYSDAGDPRLAAANPLRAHCFTLWQPAQLCGSHSDPSPACARNRLRGARPKDALLGAALLVCRDRNCRGELRHVDGDGDTLVSQATSGLSPRHQRLGESRRDHRPVYHPARHRVFPARCV